MCPRVLFLLPKGDEYATRIVDNVCRRGRADWVWAIHELEPGISLDVLLEEPERFIPDGLPRCDLVISLALPSDAQPLAVELARAVEAEGLVVAVDDPNWLLPGMRKQLAESCQELGITFVAPKPFCSLEPTGSCRPIDKFASAFGKPELRVRVVGGVIREVEVLRGAPCGSTWFVAERVVGLPVEPWEELKEAVAKAHHVYPCLASMALDAELGDAILHAGQYLLRKAISKAIYGEERL